MQKVVHNSKIKRIIINSFRLLFIWGVAGLVSIILITIGYTQFIGHDKVELNTAIYENYRLVGQQGEYALASSEGRGRTTYGANGLVVNKTLSPDSIKVAFLGDSFVHASQVSDEYKFTEVFENKWNTLYTYAHLQTINLGLNGEDLRTYLSFSQNIDKHFEPDLVVVLLGIDDFYALANNPETLAAVATNTITHPLIEPVNPSALETLINQTDYRYFFTEIKGQTLGFIAKGNLSAPETPNSEYAPPEFTSEQVNVQLQALRNQWGNRLVILYHNWFWMQDMDRGLAPDYDDIVLQEMRNMEIPYINLYQPFRQAFLHHTPPFGFNNSTLGQGHFNQVGHEIIADELVYFLADEQLVRGRP